jgi:putative ABC transport system permease protein
LTSVTLAARNLTRNKTRVFLTILGVAVTVMAFIVIRTLIWAYTTGVEFAAKDRIGTRHRVTFVMQLPRNYADKIAGVPGVKASAWANWFGGLWPKDTKFFFANLAVSDNYPDVYDELVLAPDARQRWAEDPQGALVGATLAHKLGVKVGDKVTLQGTIYPGNWDFHVSGIYTVSRKSVDQSSLLFHWKYMNDALPERRKDQIGWVISRIDEPSQSPRIAKAIDDMFDVQDTQTLTQSERQLNNSFLAMFEAVLKALGLVSLVILAIMMLILGNTIAMNVRERTHEYGTLRAIGFEPGQIATFIVSEAAFVGLLGGLAGLALSALLIYGIISPMVNQGSLSAILPFVDITPVNAVAGVGLALVLGVVASFVPAFRASKLAVTDALRRIG